jgi:hypothetical protein
VSPQKACIELDIACNGMSNRYCAKYLPARRPHGWNRKLSKVRKVLEALVGKMLRSPMPADHRLPAASHPSWFRQRNATLNSSSR